MLKVGDTNPIVEMLLARAKSVMANRWRYAGYRIATFAPPGKPFDPSVVRAFHENIDPGAAFLWMRHVWRSPAGSEHYFDYHVIATTSENCIEFEEGEMEGEERKAVPPHRDFQSGVLQSVKGPRIRPHSYIEILHSKSKHLPSKILGEFDPLSMRHYHKYRKITYLHERSRRKDLNQQEVEKIYDEIRRTDLAYQQESDYRWDQDWDYLVRQVEKLDGAERDAIISEARRAANFIGHTLPPAVQAMVDRQRLRGAA